MANVIREFEIGDFLTKEFKEKSTKEAAKKTNGIIPYETMQETYKPLVAELKKQMGNAKTQEEFDNVIDNFGKEQESKLQGQLTQSLEKLKKVNDNIEELQKVNSFSEITPEISAKLDDEDKKKVTKMQGIETLIKEDVLKDMPLRPSTYTLDSNVGDMGKFAKETDILEIIRDDKEYEGHNISERIKNNPKLNENYEIHRMDNTPIEYKVKGEVETDKFGNPINDGKQSEETKVVTRQPALLVKEAVLGEVLDKIASQNKEELDRNKELKKAKEGKEANPKDLTFKPHERVKNLLSKDIESKLYKQNNAINYGKHIQEKISELMPSKEELTTMASRNFENAAKVASLNPKSLLKDKQEENFTFVGMMFRETPSSIREIPDKLVTDSTVIPRIIDERLGKGDYKDSTYKITSPTRIAELQRHIDYLEALKNGNKEEFLEKEKEEFKKRIGKAGKTTAKSDKSGIEEASEATKNDEQKSKTTVPSVEEPTDGKTTDGKEEKTKEPDDEFPF